MAKPHDFLGLYRAMLWRLWTEQRRTILAIPLLMTALFGVVLLTIHFAPGLLTSPSLHALQAGSGHAPAAAPSGSGALLQAFIEHQAPYLLALLAGMSAANIVTRALGAEADRGSLEILLATRHDIASIGGALLLAACTLASAGWLVLAALSAGLVAACTAWLHLHVEATPARAGAAVAMQLVLTLAAAELAMVVTLLFPRFAQARTGMTGDPTTLLAILPALLAFVAANLFPDVPALQLCLVALALGAVLLGVGTASLRLWFRPERFLES